MNRRNYEEKENFDSIWLILIIGAIIGAVVGGLIKQNILFCIVAAVFGSIITLCIIYNIILAIEEIQDAIMKRKKEY